MKNLNLKKLLGSTVLAVNPDGRTTVERRSNDGHIRRHLPVGLTKLLSLLFLLTLGTGQMWANNTSATFYLALEAAKTRNNNNCCNVQFNIKYDGTNNKWSGWTNMTKTSHTYNGKVVYQATYNFPYDGYHNWQWRMEENSNQHWYKEIYAGAWTTDRHNGQLYDYENAKWVSSPSWDASYTVYFADNNTWGGVKAYAWNNECDYNALWAGTLMTSTGKTYKGKNIYSITLDKRYAYLIFSKNGNDGTKTGDLTLGTTNAGKMYLGQSGGWTTHVYDHKVTFNANGGTGTMTDQKMNYNTSTALKANTFERAGYDFDGWAISADGDVVYSDGARVTLTDSDLPLYAHWTASASPAVTLTASKTTGINVGETITLTATGANASNITKYEFYDGETKVGESTAPTNTYSYTPTTVGNKTVKVVMTYNSGSNTVTSSNVALTLNTPSVALAIKTGSANNFYLGEGSTILKATPSNVGAGVTPSYVFTDQIAGGVTSSSQTETEWTYNPSVSGQAKARTMKVTMSVGGSTYTATVNVSVYEHFTVHIKNTDSWSGMYVYMWEGENKNATFPGVRQELWNGSDLIYNVVLDTKYTNFIISQGNNSKQSATIPMLAASSAGNCYTTTTGKSLPAMICPAVPSVTTTAASNILNISATLGCNITNLNRDNASEYGYYYSTSSTLSSANATTVGTNVKIGDRKNATGNNAHSLTGLSANTTYYVIAYAKNCAGTGWGSTINFTTLSQTTVSFNTHGGSAVSNVTAVKTKAMPAISAPTRTGYTFNGMYDAASEGTQYYTSAGASARAWDKSDAEFTLHAQWTPITYTVKFNANGGTGSMSNQTGIAYDSETTLTANAFTRTGYTFQGWATSAERANAGNVDRTDGAAHDNLSSTQGATVNLYAVWTPKQSALTLDPQTSATGHGADGTATASASATYDAAMPSLTGTLPTAADGYAFMGFYDAIGGAGTQYYDGTGASVTNWDKDTESGTTLYAYYKKAEITALTITPSTAGLGATVTVTPTIAPMPTGNYNLCWKLLRNNDNEITGTTFTLTGDDKDDPHAVQFTAPGSSGNYKVQCILSTGSTACAGTPLSSRVQNFTVAGEHTVTIRYQDASGRTLAASTEVTGRPLTWSEAIAAPSITGYTFARWEAGDGIILSTDGTSELGSNTTTTDPVYVEATYAGNLTAVYNKKKMIYFNNTLGWSDVYVYFYENGNYWSNTYGSGAKKDQGFGDGEADKPYGNEYHGHMTEIAPNIWAFDYSDASIPDKANVAFTEAKQHKYQWFDNTKVVRVFDFNNPTTLPMYVPLTEPTEEYNKHEGNKTIYYTKGYWMNYPENTGYTLKIFDGTGDGAAELQSIPFEFTGDKTMPMSVTAELEAGRTYGYKIYRNDGSWFGNSGTMRNGASGDEGQTVWEFETGKKNCGLTTSAAGEYTFTLTYAPKSDTYYYLVGVHYPVAVGSYRLVYTDEATTLWSGHTKPANWYHPSRTIEKKDGAKDIISFYVSKETGANASIKVQYASAINASTGAITWADGTDATHTSVTLDLSGITSSGVYNFHLTQADGSISVEKIEAYTGNYYIRTDCAGTTKWDNYRAADHQMTYSEFSKDRATNTFGDLYTHYYMHWCPRETNIKFVIANDYSMCITDTLESDITDLNNIVSGGYLKSQKGEGKSETDDIYSANIRFMYDERTNKISRAYMSSSTNTARKFLVLKSDTEFKNSDNTALSGSGESATAGNYEAIFKDNEDWIYEREIKLTPGQKFKLYASYAQSTAQEDGSQHFRGNYASNDWASADNYVLLVGGSGGTCNARIVYDFKTNRLISAYLPDNDNAISGSPSINADIMIVRNHQEAGQQITFNTGASLNAVQTVYGVMRFNRWILNNRQNPEDMDREHSEDNETMNSYHPLITDPGSQRSSSERGLYWISFPFNVNLSEVFGFGTYGTHWIVMEYNGEERAKQGFWADSEGFWEYIWDRKDVVLEKGKGYVLALDLDRMKADDRTFWNNEIQQVELFFPSTAIVGTIQQTDVDVDVPAWECKIGPRFEGGDDRTKKDSHWNIIGVPSYANYNSALTDGSATITWNANPETQDLPFLYEWNANDNTYTVQSGTSYPFKAMHAYYVQYHGTLHWSLASATPPSIVARRAYEKPQNEEFRLELQQNEKMVDQTFVKLSNDENASADFRFEEDLCKELNSRKANIYTYIADVQAAGNTLPMIEQTTVVPMGVQIAADGEYTFAMPDGTNGTGVTLIDNETGTRTSLALTDYTVTLGKGTYDNRFVLEFSPVAQTPTGIEDAETVNRKSSNRKLLIDGILYIVKDGQVFDARGTKVK